MATCFKRQIQTSGEIFLMCCETMPLPWLALAGAVCLVWCGVVWWGVP